MDHVVREKTISMGTLLVTSTGTIDWNRMLVLIVIELELPVGRVLVL